MEDVKGVGRYPISDDIYKRFLAKDGTPHSRRVSPKGSFGGQGGLLVSLLALAKPSIQNALNEYLGLNEVEYWRNPEGSSYEQSLGVEPQSLDYLSPKDLDVQQRALIERLTDTTRTPYTSEPRGDLSTNQLVQDSESLDSLMKVMYPMIFGGEAGKGSDAMKKIENENTLKQYLEETLFQPPPVY